MEVDTIIIVGLVAVFIFMVWRDKSREPEKLGREELLRDAAQYCYSRILALEKEHENTTDPEVLSEIEADLARLNEKEQIINEELKWREARRERG